MRPLAWAALVIVPFGLPILAFVLLRNAWRYCWSEKEVLLSDETLRWVQRRENTRDVMDEVPEPIGRRREPIEEGRRSTALSRVGLR